MGVAAAAVPMMPMLIGAGAGALMDRKNPLRGAMLGAVGGGIAGPALGALGGAAGASGAAGAGLGAAAELPHLAGMGAAGMAGGLPSAMGAMGAQAAPLLSAGNPAAGIAPVFGTNPATTVTPSLFDKAMGVLGNDKTMGMMKMAGQMFGSPNQAPPPMPVRPIRPSSQPPSPIIRYKTFI